MAAQGDDETPLIYSTQTAATVADLEMEDENREPNTCRLTGEGTGLTVSVSGSSVVTPAPSVTKPTNVLLRQVIPQAHSSLTTSTVTSVTGAPVLPTGAVNQPIQPYNSSLMYEDNRLPTYVDYLGSILPILHRQSLTNWPGTPHPLTGQVWIMPYNTANLPTVPYILNIGDRRLLPEPIRGQSALSEVASTISYGAMSSSVSNPICGRPSGAMDQTVPAITYPETPQEMTESKKHGQSGDSKDAFLIRTFKSPRVAVGKGMNQTSSAMEETIPFVEKTMRETPFIDFLLPLNPPVRVSTVYAGRTPLSSKRDNQMLLLKLDMLEEAYGTNIFAVDEVMAEVYSVLNDVITPIGLQGYEELGDVPPEEAVGFDPGSTSTPREGEVVQADRPSE